jgi:hypothetical protein
MEALESRFGVRHLALSKAAVFLEDGAAMVCDPVLVGARPNF